MKPKTKKQLCIFSRYPAPGACKTRLIPELGARGAARLQQYMTEHILHVGRKAACDVLLCLRGGSPAEVSAWLGAGVLSQCQQGDGLGQRMLHQLKASFADGYQQVVLIGADCPAIDEPLLDEAFFALDSHDLVLGPSLDGGYYLIGMKQLSPELFADIDWGTGNVARQTMRSAERLGFSVLTLPVLGDVDCGDDLQTLPELWVGEKVA
jgi:rSAM/selenodomain-associated transferase 1